MIVLAVALVIFYVYVDLKFTSSIKFPAERGYLYEV